MRWLPCLFSRASGISSSQQEEQNSKCTEARRVELPTYRQRTGVVTEGATADTRRLSTPQVLPGGGASDTHTHTRAHAHTQRDNTQTPQARADPGSLIFIPTHPPWFWGQPKGRPFGRTGGWTFPVQRPALYTHTHQPDSREIRPSPELASCMHECLAKFSSSKL